MAVDSSARTRLRLAAHAAIAVTTAIGVAAGIAAFAQRDLRGA